MGMVTNLKYYIQDAIDELGSKDKEYPYKVIKDLCGVDQIIVKVNDSKIGVYIGLLDDVKDYKPNWSILPKSFESYKPFSFDNEEVLVSETDCFQTEDDGIEWRPIYLCREWEKANKDKKDLNNILSDLGEKLESLRVNKDYSDQAKGFSELLISFYESAANYLKLSGNQTNMANLYAFKEINHYKYGFNTLDYEWLLYPQCKEKIEEFSYEKLINDNKDFLRKESTKLLNDMKRNNKKVDDKIIEHWKYLSNL